jgi:tetratricopeptide (TPR) repeat protein
MSRIAKVTNSKAFLSWVFGLLCLDVAIIWLWRGGGWEPLALLIASITAVLFYPFDNKIASTVALERKPIDELKTVARELGISGFSSMRKDALVHQIYVKEEEQYPLDHRTKAVVIAVSLFISAIMVTAILSYLHWQDRSYVPDMTISIGEVPFGPPGMPSFSPHKYPLYEYNIIIYNKNSKSTPVTELIVTFKFKHPIDDIKSEAMLPNAPITRGGTRLIERENGQTRVTEEQPIQLTGDRAISFIPRQLIVNGKETNTHEAVLTCNQWRQDTSLGAYIVINVAKPFELVFSEESMGTYNGSYWYELGGRRTKVALSGAIPDPDMKPRLAHQHFERGNDYQKSNQHENAIVEYDSAIKLDAMSADAFFNRAGSYGECNKYDAAIKDYTTYIAMKPADPEGYFGRGLAHGRAGENDRAVTDFSRAIQLNPKHAKAYLDRGVIYARDTVGEFTRAISDYKMAMQLDPSMNIEGEKRLSVAIHNRGAKLFRRKDYPQAINDFTEAIKLDPRSAKSLYVRGLAWQKIGRRKEAIEDLRKADEMGVKEAKRALLSLTQGRP